MLLRVMRCTEDLNKSEVCAWCFEGNRLCSSLTVLLGVDCSVHWRRERLHSTQHMDGRMGMDGRTGRGGSGTVWGDVACLMGFDVQLNAWGARVCKKGVS